MEALQSIDLSLSSTMSITSTVYCRQPSLHSHPLKTVQCFTMCLAMYSNRMTGQFSFGRQFLALRGTPSPSPTKLELSNTIRGNLRPLHQRRLDLRIHLQTVKCLLGGCKGSINRFLAHRHHDGPLRLVHRTMWITAT